MSTTIILIISGVGILAFGILLGKIMCNCASPTERELEYQDEAKVYGYKLKDLELSEMDDTERFHHIEK